MAILSHWQHWYNVEIRRWLFLEAGEAKTAVDSHHAQVSTMIKKKIIMYYSSV
jgi:hypothetical protein